jgi:hypothetical protein
MAKGKIFAIYIAIDLLIVAGVVWCVFERIAASRFLLPAATLFVLNGVWLIVVTVRNTPRK